MIATVEQTQADLARMLELARQGEEVVITRAGEPIAKLTGFVAVRPAGYFADCYDAEEIKESNDHAQRSVRGGGHYGLMADAAWVRARVPAPEPH